MNMELWQEKRVLILGTTYPSYSNKYTELACTGGILDETCEMVRLHPIPHRYLEPGQQFRAFQWIRVAVKRYTSDPRPESLFVKSDSITLGRVIPSTESEERLKYIEGSPHLCQSVEELKERQGRDGTSLGIIRPKEILGCSLKTRPASERAEWLEKEKGILSQRNLFGDLKPIDFPDTLFQVSWVCDDPRCTEHTMNLQQWGIHELNRKLKHDPNREEKVIKAMEKRLDQRDMDVYFFIGNFRGIMYNFGLMDSYSAPHTRQRSLF